MITQERQEAEVQPENRPVSKASTLAWLWREAILPYLGTRLVLLLVGLLAAYYLLPLLKSSPILPPI